MPAHIVIDQAVCHGKPIIQGTRIPVSIVLSALAAGDSFEDIQADYEITAEDIRACIAFANEQLQQQSYHPLPH